jgi:hypothetical protein
MSSNYGFVYILHNPQMLCVKIGCTERSPHARADELSRNTGVPLPFKVLCYVESGDFQAVERRMHEWCAKYRISASREFFEEAGVKWAVSLMFHLRGALAFTMVDPDYMASHHGIWNVSELDDPWAEKAAQQQEQKAVAFDSTVDVVDVATAEVEEPF